MTATPPSAVGQRRWLAAGMVGAALLAFVLVLAATRRGVSLDNDSVYYLDGAANLSAGRGYITTLRAIDGPYPITIFPPGTSLLLAGAKQITGSTLLNSARWLNALLFAASTAIFGVLAYRATGSVWAALAGAVLFALQGFLLRLHAKVLSEPPFLLLMLVGVWMLHRFLQRRGIRALVIAGIAAGLAMAFRYAAGGMLIAGVAALWLLDDAPIRERVRHTLIFGGASALTVLPILIRNEVVSSTLARRVVGFHPVDWGQIQHLAGDFSEWLLPDRVVVALPDWMSVVFSAAVIGGVVALTLHVREQAAGDPQQDAAGKLAALALIVAGGHVLFFGLTLSFFDNQIPPSTRQIAPAMVMLMLAAIYAVQGAIRRYVEKPERQVIASAGVVVAAMLYFLPVTVGIVRQYGSGEVGYEAYADSAIIEIAQSVVDEATIYSNDEVLLEFYTGRDVRGLPPLDADFEAGLEAVGERLRPGDVIMIITPREGSDPNRYRDALMAQLQLGEGTRVEDGVYWVIGE